MIKLFKKHALTVLLAAAVIWSVAVVSYAYINAGEELPQIEPALYNAILPAVERAQLIGPIEHVRAREIGPVWKLKSLVIARVEDERCKDQMCLTFFFTRQRQTVDLVGMGYLPPKVAFSDFISSPCDECESTVGMVFSDSANEPISVSVGNGYIEIGGRG